MGLKHIWSTRRLVASWFLPRSLFCASWACRCLTISTRGGKRGTERTGQQSLKSVKISTILHPSPCCYCCILRLASIVNPPRVSVLPSFIDPMYHQHSGFAFKKQSQDLLNWGSCRTNRQTEKTNPQGSPRVQWEEFWLWSRVSPLCAPTEETAGMPWKNQTSRTILLNNSTCDKKWNHLSFSQKQLSLIILVFYFNKPSILFY